MSWIYKFIRVITEIGRSFEPEEVGYKRVILVNWISVSLIILSLSIIPLYIFDVINYKGASITRMSLMAICSFSCLVCNYYRKYLLSKSILSIAIALFVFVYPLFTGFIIEGFFLWYPFGALIFSVIPFLIFDIRKEWLAIILSSIFYFVLVVFGDRLMLLSSNRVLDVGFIYEHYLYYKMPQVVFWALINMVSIILVLTNEYTSGKLQRAYYDIKEQSEKIKDQSDEINAQNEELKSQSEKINQANELLEQRIAERTDTLQQQNKTLSEYAFINAHLLRSPLCNILGLVNLLKLVEDDDEREEIIERLDDSGEKLNDLVKKINEVVEKGSQLTREEFIEIRKNVLEG